MKKILLSTSVPETLFYFYGPLIDRLMKDQNIKITLVSSKGSWVSNEEVEKKYGITIQPCSLHRNFSILQDTIALFQLIRLMFNTRPDILHASTPKAAFLSLIAGFVTRVPFRIYSLRGLIAYGKPFVAKSVLHWAERVACFLAHQIIVNSESNRKYLVDNRICAYRKIMILGNGSGQGVDSKRFSKELVSIERVAELREKLQLPEGVFVFGFVGRIVRDKGVEDLADVWSKFTLKYPNARLLIVGPRHEPRDRISERAAKILNSTPTICYAGLQKDCRDHYSLMDVLVLPSYREGFPNVVLEAYSMEKPVITTDAPGCIDAVCDGKTGICIKARDRVALFNALERLIQNKKQCSDYGKEGRKWVVEKFQPSVIVEDLIRLYSKH